MLRPMMFHISLLGLRNGMDRWDRELHWGTPWDMVSFGNGEVGQGVLVRDTMGHHGVPWELRDEMDRLDEEFC